MSETRPQSAPLAEPALLRDQLRRLRADQDRLFAEMHAGEQHFRQLARSVWRVQEDERRRLARELHDGIGQNLTALRHRLENLAAHAVLDADASVQLGTAIDLCRTALDETRSLSRLLRPQILDDLGLEPALRWLARSVAESAGIDVELDLHLPEQALDGELATLVFRVVQEGLNNIAKHAAAGSVVVRLSSRSDQLQLLIVDDGRGCDSAKALANASHGQSAGIASMRERLRLFGGQLQFRSAPGEGTQLRAFLPLAGGA
ncbi:MAG: sensor histidine kinase [Lysobacterales bacterium]